MPEPTAEKHGVVMSRLAVTRYKWEKAQNEINKFSFGHCSKAKEQFILYFVCFSFAKCEYASGQHVHKHCLMITINWLVRQRANFVNACDLFEGISYLHFHLRRRIFLFFNLCCMLLSCDSLHTTMCI